mmetsp:Transcript_63374/g.149196  ORF Transcript_63374/g.149196 Transcript_63374/m.149196 type:complete len:269 (-) Transcript_63374:182-988(-)
MRYNVSIGAGRRGRCAASQDCVGPEAKRRVDGWAFDVPRRRSAAQICAVGNGAAIPRRMRHAGARSRAGREVEACAVVRLRLVSLAPTLRRYLHGRGLQAAPAPVRAAFPRPLLAVTETEAHLQVRHPPRRLPARYVVLPAGPRHRVQACLSPSPSRLVYPGLEAKLLLRWRPLAGAEREQCERDALPRTTRGRERDGRGGGGEGEEGQAGSCGAGAGGRAGGLECAVAVISAVAGNCRRPGGDRAAVCRVLLRGSGRYGLQPFPGTA